MIKPSQRRSVPWPASAKPAVEAAPIYIPGDDGKRDPIVLAADIKHAFFGSFNIRAEILIDDLPKKLNRIHINPEQVVRINREIKNLPEAVVYRVKAQLYKVQKEHNDAKRDREREQLKRRAKSNRPAGSKP